MKPTSTQATLAGSRVGCPRHQEPGDSKGVLALEDPFGRAEGVAHSWMD